MKKLLLLFVLLIPGFIHAQEQSAENVIPSLASASEPTGNIACFDYYKFGSVQADIESNIAQSVPGGTISFSGKVTNDNNYPVIDGKLSVKIFRKDEGTFGKGNGNPVVDQFVVSENINLGAKGESPVAFDWKVPANARGGEYYAGYFFTTSGRYNLMGLSFTDDVVGNQTAFTITNSATPLNVEFDKNSALLNDIAVPMAAVPLHFGAQETVTFKVKLTNPEATVKTLPIQWNQYNWDAQRAENRKNTKTELVTLQPNETKELQYTNIATAGAVNYVTAMLQDGEAKSFINVRYVKDGVEETRINFPSLTSFPLQPGEEQALFACAHSTNMPLVKDNLLLLTLKDREGAVISQYRYEGDIAGAMSGFGEKFTPSKNYDYVTLEASLFRGGSEVEKVQVTYDCEKIDAQLCEKNKSQLEQIFTGKNLAIAGIALLGILIFVVALVITKRNNGKKVNW